MKYVFKIDGMISDAEFNSLPFGRCIEHQTKINAFKASAAVMHSNAKGKSTLAGFRSFKKLYRPTQWFLIDHDTPSYHDDSFQVWFTTEAS